MLNAPSQNPRQQNVFGVYSYRESSVLLLLHHLHQAVAQHQAANTCHQSLVTAWKVYQKQTQKLGGSTRRNEWRVRGIATPSWKKSLWNCFMPLAKVSFQNDTLYTRYNFNCHKTNPELQNYFSWRRYPPYSPASAAWIGRSLSVKY